MFLFFQLTLLQPSLKSTKWIANLYLKNCDQSLREAVKGAAGFGLFGKVELATKYLHTKEGKDDYKKEE